MLLALFPCGIKRNDPEDLSYKDFDYKSNDPKAVKIPYNVFFSPLNPVVAEDYVPSLKKCILEGVVKRENVQENVLCAGEANAVQRTIKDRVTLGTTVEGGLRSPILE